MYSPSGLGGGGLTERVPPGWLGGGWEQERRAELATQDERPAIGQLDRR
jgi:hypothetical protein